jgi:anti-sigma factor RsiW
MNTSRSSAPLHSEAFRLLPWYVQGRLEPERLQQVDGHVSGCLACRREAEGLTQLFCAHAQLTKPRPVDEARLKALFARIDRYEATQRRPPPRPGTSKVMLMRWRDAIVEWFDTRFMLIGGACAAAVLAVMVAPLIFSPATQTYHEVLSSPAADAATVVVKLRFRMPTERAEAERLIASTLAERGVRSPYRLQQRSSSEYALTFEQKPELAALSAMLTAWRATPQVADAAIDAGGHKP